MHIYNSVYITIALLVVTWRYWFKMSYGCFNHTEHNLFPKNGCTKSATDYQLSFIYFTRTPKICAKNSVLFLPLHYCLKFHIVQDPRVLDAMLPYEVCYYGNPHSRTHAYGWESEKAVEHAREVPSN